jgi:hypothetical protein
MRGREAAAQGKRDEWRDVGVFSFRSTPTPPLPSTEIALHLAMFTEHSTSSNRSNPFNTTATSNE